MKSTPALILGLCLVLMAIIGGNAYKFKYNSTNKISVTGLGEQQFTSDLIVWRGTITAENSYSLQEAYKTLEKNRSEVADYLSENGIADSCVVFMFASSNRITEPIYSGGNYVGQRNLGYSLRQEFKVESTDVTKVEDVSRSISSLIAKGVTMESYQPEYYYTHLSDLKLSLIEKATADGKQRAEKIAESANASIGRLLIGKMGVFQITGANSSEDYSWGGAYNLNAKVKKATITVKLDYHIKK